MAIELAASVETVHVGLPLLERVRQIADRGLQVEVWNWSSHLDDLGELAVIDAEVASVADYLRGNLTDDDVIPELLAMAEESLRVAEELHCPRLNLHSTGSDGRGLPVRPAETVTSTMWTRVTVTLRRVVASGKREGQVFTLKNLNLAVDHPSTPFVRAGNTLALVSAIDSPGLRISLDLYHTQIGEGNLIELCCRTLPWVGEIRVAGMPGRYEPDTGEINYPAVTAALREMGYDGTVALEAFTRSDPDSTISAFIRAFTLEVE